MPSHLAVDASLSLGCALSVSATLLLLAVSAGAARAGLVGLFAGDFSHCRRWAMIATAVTAVWYGAGGDVGVEPQIPMTVAVVAADCWLIAWVRPERTLPRAIVRSRTTWSRQ